MLKPTKLLRDDLDIKFASAMESSDVGISDFLNIESMRQAVSTISEEIHGLISCIRFAAHTLQLIVADATKENNSNQQIQKFNKLAISLYGLKRPVLSIPTRLNSLYDMIERLSEYILNLWLIVDSFHVTVSCLICFPAVEIGHIFSRS